VGLQITIPLPHGRGIVISAKWRRIEDRLPAGRQGLKFFSRKIKGRKVECESD